VKSTVNIAKKVLKMTMIWYAEDNGENNQENNDQGHHENNDYD
jgi:hypothetical protein